VIGSEIVETAMDKMQNILENQIQKTGLSISNRYSPGYCEWKLSDQRKLFSFFPESCCGITLSESYFMSPKKSISGIIGIGKKVKKEAYRCDICELDNCIYNRNI
jgi:cobalamin-dependent methionine synthase I